MGLYVSGFTVTLQQLIAYPVAACLVVETMLRPRLSAEMLCLYRVNRPMSVRRAWSDRGRLRCPRLGRGAASIQGLFPALVLYGLIFLTIRTHRRVVCLLLANLAGALVNIGLAMSQIATGGPRPIPLSQNIEAKQDLAGNLVEQAPTGLFNHPNGLAIFLLPVALFLLVAAWPGLKQPRRVRFAMLGLLVVTLFILKMGYVKGVYAWLGAGVAFLALPRRIDPWRLAIAIAMVVIGIVVITWLSIHAFVEGEVIFGTVLTRIELWLAAVVSSAPT